MVFYHTMEVLVIYIYIRYLYIFYTYMYILKLLAGQSIGVYIPSQSRGFGWVLGRRKKTTTIQVGAFTFLDLVNEDGSLIQQVHIPHLKGKGKTSTQELPLKGAMLC